ncbi:MAG: hypothetical protein ISR85_06830 [Kiritimatiellales bacterium]|nr:hypothetical protein [Kiritimatiellales bacterium]
MSLLARSLQKSMLFIPSNLSTPRLFTLVSMRTVVKKSPLNSAKNSKIETHRKRTNGKQANIKGFHSLRTTWITMALTAGVPMELVRRVTGHSTVEVVLKHYFRPNREEFRHALESSLPKALTGGPQEKKATPHDKIVWLLEHGEGLDKAAILKKLAEIEPELAA